MRITKEQLDAMELHETLMTDDYSVFLVVGGWIYTFFRLDCNAMTSVFVPKN